MELFSQMENDILMTCCGVQLPKRKYFNAIIHHLSLSFGFYAPRCTHVTKCKKLPIGHNLFTTTIFGRVMEGDQ